MRTPQGQGRGRGGELPRSRQPVAVETNRVQLEGGLFVNKIPRGAGVYPQEIRPAVLPGDVVELSPLEKFRVVQRVFPQPGILAFDSRNSNGISVNANDSSEDNEATNLAQDDDVVAQLRWVNPTAVSGDVIARLDQGGANTPLYRTKNYIGQVDNDTADVLNSAVTELYVFESDNNPFFTFINDTGASITVSDLRFVGYQYELTREDLQPRTIPDVVQPVPLPVAGFEV